MAEISRTRTVPADRQAVWDTLADFAALASWAGNVDHSCLLTAGPDGGLLGSSRRVQIGHTTLVEHVVEAEPPHALAYDITGLPRRLRAVRNRWTLRPDGDSTVVTLTSTVTLGPRLVHRVAERVVARVMARQSDALLAGLANRWETTHV